MFSGESTIEKESILKKAFSILNFIIICFGTHAFI